jgi:NADPH:quinone reductase-like Zn-dependent oxidoreductase
MKAYEYRQFERENHTLVERDEPRAVVHEVVVKFHAASLN